MVESIHITATMLNIISLVIGVVSLIFGIVAFLPIVGLAWWVIIPFAMVGLLFGVFSDRKSGRNLNLVVILIGILRLSLTGGLF